MLFLAALCLPFSTRQWKPLLWLITCFTIGHSLSLILASLEVVKVSSIWIEFLIPVSIAATAVYNMIYARAVWVRNNQLVMWVTLFFGVVHGFGFAGYFELIRDVDQPLWSSLLFFALGIEGAQIVLGALMLLLSFVVLNVMGRNRRDWVLVVSSVIIGILLPIIIERWP
ncbi:MAG: HupE/UreJ family protein [Flavobacteriaceae bacterium]